MKTMHLTPYKQIVILLIVIILTLSAFLIFYTLTFEVFNLIEGVYWILLSLLLLIIRRSVDKNLLKPLEFAVPFFFLFGVSDFIEIYTKAFWEPWWLLVWNIICILGVALAIMWALKISLTARGLSAQK